MAPTCRSMLSFSIILLNIIASVLMWISTFSLQIVWIDQINSQESSYVTRVKNSNYFRIDSLEGANLWHFCSSDSWHEQEFTYYAFTPQDPVMQYGIMWLTFGAILPILHISFISTQLMDVYPWCRGFDILQLWTSIFAVFCNTLGTVMLCMYFRSEFTFLKWGAAVYLMGTAIGILFLSSVLSAAKIRGSSPSTNAFNGGIQLKGKTSLSTDYISQSSRSGTLERITAEPSSRRASAHRLTKRSQNL